MTDMTKNTKNIKRVITDMIGLMILTAADQFTKYLAVIFLKDKPSVSLINGVLELNYLENRGAAFGMLQNQKWFFVFIAAIIIGVIIYVLYKTPDDKKYDAFHIQLVCIAAGAVGNMIDRIRYDYVVDFIYFSIINFPIFNFADMCVTIGTTVLVILILFVYKEKDLGFLGFNQKKYREIK
jgi:signal peptidase II